MAGVIYEVVGHIKREQMAKDLAASVGGAHLWMDDGTLGEWKNHERAWKHAQSSDASHAIILQDDAVPIEQFSGVVLEAIEQKPGELISLYVGTHRPRTIEVLRAVGKAKQGEASWLTADTLMWGVGVIVPTILIPEILDTVAKSKLPYDQRIGYWAEQKGRLVYYTWPSLVDHADEPTVIKGRSSNQGVRVAHKTGIPNWSKVVVHINRPEKKILGSKKDRMA